MKKLLFAMLLLIVLNTTAQDSFQIVAIKSDTTEWQSVFGIIRLSGTRVDISFDDYVGKIIIDPTSYEEGEIIDKYSYQVWQGYLLDTDGTSKIRFSITKLKENLIMVVHYEEGDTFQFATTFDL